MEGGLLSVADACASQFLLPPASTSNVLAGVAGYTADANSLVNYARTAAQNHLLAYNEDMPVETLVQRLADLKQVRRGSFRGV